MLGIIFFTLCFCAWLGKCLANKERNIDAYKAKGTDKYGCWKDGVNNWHYGNKILETFFIGKHEVLAVPDIFSMKNYSFTRYHYVVRDLTLEKQFLREQNEIDAFHADMEARKKAIEEGKNFYKTENDIVKGNLRFQNGKYIEYIDSKDIYRKVSDNRMFFIYEQDIYKGNHFKERKYIMHYLKDGFLDRKYDKFSNKWTRTLIRTGSEEIENNEMGDRKELFRYAINGIGEFVLLDM